MTQKNTNLHQSKKHKHDEFYTQLSDIENELNHYENHFAGKVVYCNCDDPRASKFFHYFSYNFEHLKLKKLVTTCYKSQHRDLLSKHDSEKAISLQYDGFKKGEVVPDPEDIGINHLESDGDFRSDECIELLKQVDIVVTNPPFSLFREYVEQLIKHNKKFVILGNMNAVTYKEIFNLIKSGKMWIGNKNMGTDTLFDVPKYFADQLVLNKKEGSGYKIIDGVVKGRASAIWYTNLDIAKRHKEITLYKKYSSDKYKKYDNYDAINVDKIKNIPMDYKGAMGVPISFMDKYNPAQFEIIKFRKGDDDKDLVINGRHPYFRILVKNKTL